MKDFIYSRYLERTLKKVPKIDFSDSTLFQFIIQEMEYNPPDLCALINFTRKQLKRFLQVKSLLVNSHSEGYLKTNWLIIAHIILDEKYTNYYMQDISSLVADIESASLEDLFTMCNELTDCILSDHGGNPSLLIGSSSFVGEIPF